MSSWKSALIIVMMALATGCATHSQESGSVGSAPHFFSETDFRNSDPFVLYENQPRSEQAKIRYLINLVRYSNCRFERNGEIYSGDNGARWLEYKLDRYPEDSKTAREFIEKTGTFSRKTDKEYYVVFSKNVRVPLRVIFTNELERIEHLELAAPQVSAMDELSSEGGYLEMDKGLLIPSPVLSHVMVPTMTGMATVMPKDAASKVVENQDQVS